MAEFVMDPKLGQESAETLASFFNGELTAPVFEAFDIVKTLGDEGPQVEGAKALLKGYEEIFNEQLLPFINIIHEKAMANAEFAAKFNAVQVAKVAGPSDIGGVAESSYDAAKDL